MRKRQSKYGLSVNAVAGAHVVLLGLDIDPKLRAGLRGFAIKRTDPAEGESFWMRGTKVFESLVPAPAPAVQYSSLKQPFQTFQWADYTAKPGRHYKYTVAALYGPVDALETHASVDVAVRTERIEGQTHAIHFNRGSVATQEYARRFHNLPPDRAGPEAYDWLSRGLVESIKAFVERAADAGFGLKGAFYEFQWPDVLNALKQAAERGADISIVFDGIQHGGAAADERGPSRKNRAAIDTAGLGDVTKPRTSGKLMHNKFLVLTRKRRGVETPTAVLLGSTNLTENGIFGHANCAHVVEDRAVAQSYFAFYTKLMEDPPTTGRVYKDWIAAQTPAPATLDKMAPVFSPRPDLQALTWYGDLAASASRGLFMTFAFGINQVFRDVYARNDDVLRYGLMEKEWNGRNKAAQIQAVRALQARPNVVIAVGNRIVLNEFDQWLGELDKIVPEAHVNWIHLKFMLIDPLSSDPIVVTGSANFSDASTKDNDENMLVIKGDTRVADIYLGEYMRLHSHYAFRQAVRIFLDRNPGAQPADMRQGFLIEDRDWTEPYFEPADPSARHARRLYFAGR